MTTKTTKRASKAFFCIFTAAILLMALALSVSAQTAESRYAGQIPLPTVLEKNKKKIQRINDYGPEFVLDYIVEEGSYNEIISTLTDVQLLSDELCFGVTDIYSQIAIIAKYVSDAIAYDFDAAHNSVTFDVICLKNVLARKRTTCAGYSNLFSALLNAQGIYCVNIRGCAPDSQMGISQGNLDSEEALINHEWTAVWYEKEKRWIYVDCTWNSKNSYRKGEFVTKNSVSTFFDISLEYLSIEHRAEIVDYRNFFSAPEAYNEDGILWSEVTDETPEYTTMTTPELPVTTEPPATTTPVPATTTDTVTTSGDDETTLGESTSDESTGESDTALNESESTSEATSSSSEETSADADEEEDDSKGAYFLAAIVLIVAGGGLTYCVVRKKKAEK